MVFVFGSVLYLFLFFFSFTEKKIYLLLEFDISRVNSLIFAIAIVIILRRLSALERLYGSSDSQ